MRLREESGFTLVELLVVMVISGILGTIILMAVIMVARTFVFADDERRGLGDAKTVMDRIARDVRESRGVVCDGGLADLTDPSSDDPDCAAHLQLWLDEDSDYAEDSDEIVTWRLELNDDGEHYDVYRRTATGDEQLVATSLIVQTLFQYDTADPEEASEVTVTMTYDARPGVGVDERTATTTARIRNG